MDLVIKIQTREVAHRIRHYPMCPISKLLVAFKPQRRHPRTGDLFEKTLCDSELKLIEQHGFRIERVPLLPQANTSEK
jgi:hypothetical protein